MPNPTTVSGGKKPSIKILIEDRGCSLCHKETLHRFSPITRMWKCVNCGEREHAERRVCIVCGGTVLGSFCKTCFARCDRHGKYRPVKWTRGCPECIVRSRAVNTALDTSAKRAAWGVWVGLALILLAIAIFAPGPIYVIIPMWGKIVAWFPALPWIILMIPVLIVLFVVLFIRN